MNEIKKMQTPWDSDKILMVDIGCHERGCVCVANQWDANYQSECVPMVEYKEWAGLTDADLENIKLLTFEKEINSDGEEQEAVDLDHLMRATEQLCKERNT